MNTARLSKIAQLDSAGATKGRVVVMVGVRFLEEKTGRVRRARGGRANVTKNRRARKIQQLTSGYWKTDIGGTTIRRLVFSAGRA